MYSLSWNRPTDFVQVGEVKIYLPDVPPEKEMINFDKPIHERKYRPTELGDYLSKSEHEIEQIAAKQWHRRLHGEWWIIKDQPTYIPGGALLFFDFWKTENAVRPQFRFEALEFFWFWYLYVERDPNLMGMFDVKVRRLGDTEKFLFITWERTTRRKAQKAGLQSYTDDEAEMNFQRLVTGHKNMPYRIFRPRHSGTTAKSLNFTAPDDRMTSAKLRSQDSPDEDNSWLMGYIDYESTVTGKYDGRILHTAHLDEAWKIPPHRMDVAAQIKNLRRCITLNNEQVIIGKMCVTSTVEKRGAMEDETTVEIAEKLWDESDPNQRDANGRTQSGLARIFRNYELNAPVDEWGFHKKEEARIFRTNKVSELTRKKDIASLIDLRRKEPATIEDAFSAEEDKCPINPAMVKHQLQCIKEGTDRYGTPIPDYTPRVVEGNLVWENGIKNSRVVFIPDMNGRWHFTQMPKIPNNVGYRPVSYIKDGNRVTETLPSPQSMAFYRMGMDPYDADQTIGKGSDGAFAVKRRLYLPDEKEPLRFDDQGLIENVEDMITNTYVCDYKYRHQNPETFYEEAIMTAWFFGVAVFPEIDKPGFVNWAKKNGYAAFIQYEPPDLASGRKSRQGAKASTSLISTYTEQLIIYTGVYVWNNHLPRLLNQWANFVVAKRTKFDLAVASGFTELADLEGRYAAKEQRSGWKHHIND